MASHKYGYKWDSLETLFHQYNVELLGGSWVVISRVISHLV